MIKELLHQYAAGQTREFAHDRASTVGASEVGQCIRKLWFAKTDAPRDPDYVDRYGARLRGTIIEDQYVIPGLRASLPAGVRLLYAGEDQQTLVDGYLSATSDGLLVGSPRDCLADLGVPDIGCDCVAIEIKSIDPRVNLREEKPEHNFQTQVQMGLFRFATDWRPNYAIVVYIDASFWDDIKEFPVAFDQRIYDTAKTRARQVMTSDDALDLSPEGKLAGGGECRYCAWSSHCAEVRAGAVPRTDAVKLGDNALTELKGLRDAERKLSARSDEMTVELAIVRQAIKDALRLHGVRRAGGDDWSIAWSSSKGRESVDLKAAEANGIDLTPYRKEGDPGDRLIVR
jgi:hypothetical protein